MLYMIIEEFRDGSTWPSRKSESCTVRLYRDRIPEQSDEGTYSDL